MAMIRDAIQEELNAGRCGCGCGGTLPRRKPSARTTFLDRHQYDRRIRTSGYVQIFHEGNYKFEHVLIAERALGHELPPAAMVHHHDENRVNNITSNLVICEDRAYHMLLHQRMRVVQLGGDPNKQKRCSRCRGLRPIETFGVSRHREDGLNICCKPCIREMSQEAVR